MWPQFSQQMIESVDQVLRSGKVNQWTNTTVTEFEHKFAQYMGCQYAVAVFNGTVALELCLKTLELTAGDEVIVTPRTFIASASCAAWYGLTPVFTDVDLDSQNITLEQIQRVITPKTRAVILVHLAGWPCQLEEICNYCQAHGIYVIEDCAQAHGATYHGQSVGTWGDINAWSFCQDKIISTGGEGGMVTTNNQTLMKRAWSLKDHGKGYDRVFDQPQPPPVGFKWLHQTLGTNWRMLPIQACIGLAALDQLDSWVKHRQMIAAVYNQQLQDLDAIRLTIPPADVEHAYYKYYFFIRPTRLNISRDQLLALINQGNDQARIVVQIGSCGEVYRETALEQWAPTERCVNAQQLFETSVMLKCDPCISESMARGDIGRIREIIIKHSKNLNVE